MERIAEERSRGDSGEPKPPGPALAGPGEGTKSYGLMNGLTVVQ